MDQTAQSQNPEEQIEVVVTTPERRLRRRPLAYVRRHARAFRDCAVEVAYSDACYDPDGRFRGVETGWAAGTLADFLEELKRRPPCSGRYTTTSNADGGIGSGLGRPFEVTVGCRRAAGHEGPCSNGIHHGYWVRRPA